MNISSILHERESEQTLEVAREGLEQQTDVPESVLMNRVQVILAEKRTSLAVLRTGIGLLTLPMTIVAFLVTTSSFWDPLENLVFLIPLFILNTALATMGIALIIRAWKRIRNFDRAIEAIKKHANTLGYVIP